MQGCVTSFFQPLFRMDDSRKSALGDIMLGFLILVFIVICFFKLTGVVLHVAGRVIGGLLGIFGWLILMALAVTLFGMAVYILPVILIIGVIALIAGLAS